MTHVTTNVLARINFDINQFFNQTPSRSDSTKQSDNKPTNNHGNVIKQLHNRKATTPSNNFTLTYGFWRTLLSAIRDQKLTIELLTDKPSELPNNLVWLNHERVTALLKEQGLAYSDIPPILFHIIMANTNKLYPGALIDEGSIESERSWLTNNGEWHGEHRYCFCINIDKLPTSKNNIRSISDAELG